MPEDLWTRWGRALEPERVLPDYPRPQLVRDSYLNLNGWWDHAFTRLDAGEPGTYDGRILVPFSPEAPLSGVGRQLQPDELLWYRRSFSLPAGFVGGPGGRVLLHFGAVDQTCTVWLNGVEVGANHGGYLPFTCDLTEALGDGDNELVVRVRDVSNNAGPSSGKQRLHRGGIWYTAQSGIWQTVWAEWVPASHVESLVLTPLLGEGALEVTVVSSGPPMVEEADEGGRLETTGNAVGGAVSRRSQARSSTTGIDSRARSSTTGRPSTTGTATVRVLAGGREVASATVEPGVPTRVALSEVRPWTPEDPFLYDVEVTLGADHVRSYVGLRSFGVGPDADGVPRLLLNGEPYLHVGVLDQGYWPDGLLTAPSDEAMVHDIQTMKRLGFNVLRKHLKIEPLRWYAHCDRLGMLVWQDLVNGGDRYRTPTMTWPGRWPLRHVRLRDHRYGLFGRSDAAGRAEYRAELRRTVEHLRNVTSLAVWVPFNEAWGQFDARAVADELRGLDPTRIHRPCQRLARPGRRRPVEPARLQAAVPGAASPARRPAPAGALRVRRLRPRGRRPHVRRRRLRLPPLRRRRGAGRGVPAAARGARRDGAARARRDRLHPAVRRRGRAERPAHLRPRGAEAPRRPRRRGSRPGAGRAQSTGWRVTQ